MESLFTRIWNMDVRNHSKDDYSGLALLLGYNTWDAVWVHIYSLVGVKSKLYDYHLGSSTSHSVTNAEVHDYAEIGSGQLLYTTALRFPFSRTIKP